MTPILFPADEVLFDSNGLGRLVDIISCVVTEERNGIYECEFQYPIDGIRYDQIQIGRIICCSHEEGGDNQPFVIYRKSAPINGIVTFNAHHISYKLSNVIVAPFQAASIVQAFQRIKENAITDCKFSFWTNKTPVGILETKEPKSARSILAGSEGSILDAYGTGEYEFDKMMVKLWLHRGSDNGVTIRYGKNLINLEQTVNSEDSFSAIIPVWHGEDDVCIYGGLVVADNLPVISEVWTNEDNVVIQDDQGNDLELAAPQIVAVVYDFTDKFEEQPTEEQLNEAAKTFLNNNQPYLPDENLVVDFVQLVGTDEYADYAPLQTVKLCDTVHVIYSALGVNVALDVIRTTYNSLLDRYDEIELGTARTTFAELLMSETTEAIGINKQQTLTAMQTAIENATNQLTGINGNSHVVFKRNDFGGIEEILIMDTDDITTALNVWRYNSAGWGHSSNGIDGPYTLAATQDGHMVADFITTGKLQGYNDNNYWDLVNGLFVAERGRISSFEINGLGLYYEDTGFHSGWKSIAEIGLQSLYYGEVYRIGSRLVYGHRSVLYDQGFRIDVFDEDLSNTWETAMFIEAYNQDGFQITGASNNNIIAYVDADNTSYSRVNWEIQRDFVVTGTKSRKAATKNYSDRLLYCYETPSPMFGDVGEGEIGEDGRCYVWLDPIFAETISNTQYQVFLQNYGEGSSYVAERKPAYFVVAGTPGLAFGWELKAKQAGYENVRLVQDFEKFDPKTRNYGSAAAAYLQNIRKERGLEE